MLESDTDLDTIIEDPMVRELTERLARRQKADIGHIRSLMRDLADMSAPGLLEVARQPFRDDELVFSLVKNRVRHYTNNRTPRWTHCTAGVTSLEIAPNGLYGRCPKTVVKREILGDIRDAGPLKVLRLARDDLDCTIPCNTLMCFHNNVLRGTDDADFTRKIGQQGLRGVYQTDKRGYYSKIFIRWKVTDVCNYTCAYCCDWRTVNSKGLELTDDEMMAGAEKIVSQFSTISMRLTGGEPSSRRRYVDMMRLFHDNLERFTDIEIRTNLSFQPKHQEVLSWDWQGKLHLHIGCHIRDKNFMPWRMVEVLQGAPNADYVLKFVAMPAIRPHVQFFRKYFVDSGIPPKRIKIVEENSTDRSDVYQVELEEAPKARKTLEERSRPVPADVSPEAKAAAAPDVQAAPDKPRKKSAQPAELNGTARMAVTRLSIADLRAVRRRNAERQVATAVPPPGHTPLAEINAVPPPEQMAQSQISRVIVGLRGKDRIAFTGRVLRALLRRAKARVPFVRPGDGPSAGIGT